MSDAPTGERPVRRRWLRGLAVAAAAALVLLLLAGAGLLVLLRHLEVAPVRGRVRALSEERLGVAADYDALSVTPWSGLRLEGLRVPSPPPFDAHAPTLLSVGSVELRWRPSSVWSGRLDLPELVVTDVALTLVEDAAGGSSLSALFDHLPREPPEEETPARPLSAALDLGALPRPISVGSLRLEGTALTLIRISEGHEVRRLEASGLSLGGAAELAPTGGRAALTLRHGPGDAGLRVALTESGRTREVVAQLEAALEVNAPGSVGLRLVLDPIRQSLDPRLEPVRQAARLEASAAFDREAGRTTVEVATLRLLDDAVRVEGAVELPDAAGGPLLPRVRQLAVHVRVDPVAEALAELAGVTLKDGGLDASLADAELTSTGEIRVGGDIRVEAHLAELAWRPPRGGPHLAVTDGRLDVEAGGVQVAPTAPREAKGRVSVRLSAGALEVGSSAFLVDAGGLRVGLSGELTGAPPYAAELSAEASRLKLVGQGARTLVDGLPVRLVVHATQVAPDLAVPAASRGQVRAEAGLGPISLKAEVAKQATTATFSVEAEARSLAPVAALVPPETGRTLRVPWARISGKLTTRGRVAHLDRPAALELEHQTTLSLARLALTRPGLDVRAAALELEAASKGTARVHAGTLALAVQSPRINGFSSDARHTLQAKADVDLRRHRVALDLRTGARSGPDAALALKADFAAGTGLLTHDLSLSLARLKALAPLLPATVAEAHRIDWAKLSVALTSKGVAGGVLRVVGGGALPSLADDPLSALDGSEALTLEVRGLDYAADALAVAADEARLSLSAEASQGALSATLDAALPRLAVQAGARKVEADGLTQHLELSADRLPRPGRLGVALRTEVRRAVQDALPGYEVGGLVVEGAARVHDLASVRLDRLTLVNEAGGTRLELQGVVEVGARAGTEGAEAADRVPGQQAVSCEGSLDQRLDALNGLSEAFSASGRLRMPIRVESGDGRRFRVRAMLEPERVDLALPDQGVSVRGLDGRVAVEQEVELDADGNVALVPGARRNAYAWSRFQDVQPFLGTDSYMAAQEIVIRGVRLGPMAGNLGVDRNLVGIDQLQLGLLGGTVTGQLLVDLTEGDRTVLFRGNVTGLRPTQGEDVLDANAALTLQPDRLVVDGRMQVVRIGRRHLLDLLDLLDPYREDVNMNRARKALMVGYPKSVTLRFDHGFLSLKLELGGLASLVELEEVRGVPLGPLLERFVGPVLDSVGIR